MSSILTNTKGKLFAALFAAIATLALAITIAPSQAFATSGYTIDIYDGDSTLIATVDTDDIAKNPAILKAQFFKNYWNVIGGKDYITFDDLMTAYAEDEWDAASYVTFNTIDFPAGYLKYNGDGHFAKSDLISSYNFFATTLYNSSTTSLPTSSSDYTYPAILAFTWGSAVQSSAANADNTTISYTTYTYPRLLWGLTSSTNPASVAGNRFPSDITEIHLY